MHTLEAPVQQQIETTGRLALETSVIVHEPGAFARRLPDRRRAPEVPVGHLAVARPPV